MSLIEGDTYMDGDDDLPLDGGGFREEISGESAGALEERAMLSGDDVGRKLRVRARRPHPRGAHRHAGAARSLAHKPNEALAAQMKVRIKAQIPSKLVAWKLLRAWATAKAGAPRGRARHLLYMRMKAAINKRGAKVTKKKAP